MYHECLIMTVDLKRISQSELQELLKKKLNKPKKAGNIDKHFGKLKRNIDGLKYQKSVRQNED